MSEELVDIVDENDCIVGQETIHRVHTDKILHRGASILCFKDETFSELLLNRRSLKKRVGPGRLCVPGGHPSAGESYLAAAAREFTEEVLNGAKSKIKLEPLFKIKKETDNDPEFMTVFKTFYAGPFTANEGVSDCFFENIGTVLDMVRKEPEAFTETTALVLREYGRRMAHAG